MWFRHRKPHVLGKWGESATLAGCLPVLVIAFPEPRAFMDMVLGMQQAEQQRQRGAGRLRGFSPDLTLTKGPHFHTKLYIQSSCISRATQ